MRKAILLALLCFALDACSLRPSASELEKAESLAREIDIYVQEQGEAPDDAAAWAIMDRLGLDSSESCRPCYAKVEGEKYVLWFGMSLGESYLYESWTDSWR